MYNLSKDYEELYGLVLSGKEAVGYVDYLNAGVRLGTLRDVVVIRKRPDDTIIVGCRGIQYGGVQSWDVKEGITAKEYFAKDCERMNLECIKH